IDKSLNRLASACSSAFNRTRARDCRLSGQRRNPGAAFLYYTGSVLPTEAQRSGEWSGWGSRDIDGRPEAERTGSERIKSLDAIREIARDVSTRLDMTNS